MQVPYMADVNVARPGITTDEWCDLRGDGKQMYYMKHWLPTVEPAGGGLQRPRACVVFLHGFAEYVGRYANIFKVFVDRGYQVSGFDQRGFGRTWYDSADRATTHGWTSAEDQWKDAECMLRLVRKRLDAEWGKDAVPIFLMGHSMGGGISASFFTRPPGSGPSEEAKALVSGVIMSAPWLDIHFVVPTWIAAAAGNAVLRVFPRFSFPIGPPSNDLSRDPLVCESARLDPLCNLHVYTRGLMDPLRNGPEVVRSNYVNWPQSLPLLIAHGTGDKVTKWSSSKELCTKLAQRNVPVTLESFDGFYHEGMHEPGDLKLEFANKIVEELWAPHTHSSDHGLIHLIAASPSTGTAPHRGAPTMGMESPHGACWATLVTHAQYLPGLAVFAYSLRQSGTRYPLVAMVTPHVAAEVESAAAQLGCIVREVEELAVAANTVRTADAALTYQETMAFERFSNVWTKLRAFSLYEYERVVLVDTDMLVRRNMDELMDLPLPPTPGGDTIAAGFACTCNPRHKRRYPKDWCAQRWVPSHARIPENCAFSLQRHPSACTTPLAIDASSPRTHHLLNAGLVVLTPTRAQMDAIEQFIVQHAAAVAQYVFPDQDLLADVYRHRFRPLPWPYNALKTLRACHPDMWRDDDARNVHYILDKPWTAGRPRHEVCGVDAVLHGWWWDVYDTLNQHPDAAGLSRETWEACIARYVHDGGRDPACMGA
ncbi:hypothetical protein MSPP1_004111 [Malassezia sp. CBS 17886]|nr:hypothetical protein MSPP1_004111 [Malassezia sp. CBS 17886]